MDASTKRFVEALQEDVRLFGQAADDWHYLAGHSPDAEEYKRRAETYRRRVEELRALIRIVTQPD